MRLLLLLAAAGLAMGRSLDGDAEANRTPKGAKPWFCHKLGCPDFSVVSRQKGYEIRRYLGALWTSTSVEGPSMEEAVSQGFMRIFRYISGANKEGKKVAMTAPVAVQVKPGQGPACNSTFIVSFYVPTMYQMKASPPPEPTSPLVKTTPFPDITVAVISYDGRTSEAEVAAHATQLSEALKRDGKKFVTSTYFTGGYDSPFSVGKLHSEVWYLMQ